MRHCPCFLSGAGYAVVSPAASPRRTEGARDANALCWAKVTTEAGPKWILVHLARNPMNMARGRYRTWHSKLVLDAPNGWFIYFDDPPKNRDVYNSMRWFHFEPERRWSSYDKFLDRNAWQAAIGEPPAKEL